MVATEKRDKLMGLHRGDFIKGDEFALLVGDVADLAELHFKVEGVERGFSRRRINGSVVWETVR